LTPKHRAFIQGQVRLKDELNAEFSQRKKRSPRYSLRAFARDLHIHHGSLSRILRGQRDVSHRLAIRLGRRAGLNARQIAECCDARLERLVLSAIQARAFHPASRWIAVRTGIPLDTVNCTLVRLLRRGAICMESPNRWINHPN
jgi:hypothetical protein